MTAAETRIGGFQNRRGDLPPSHHYGVPKEIALPRISALTERRYSYNSPSSLRSR
jgi:hypothetical protein